MFDSSIVALMVMLLLCFAGMLVMFLFVIRSNTVLAETLKSMAKEQKQATADLERHILDISFALREKNDSADDDYISSLGASLSSSAGTSLNSSAGLSEGTSLSGSLGSSVNVDRELALAGKSDFDLPFSLENEEIKLTKPKDKSRKREKIMPDLSLSQDSLTSKF